jgi:tetratricopeptide (TPR) repeat protein
VSKKVRIALCQLEVHPALYLGNSGYLEEPFLPPKKKSVSLSGLAGIGVATDKLQEHCLRSYLRWHQRRIEAVLAHLDRSDGAPDLVMFPEGAMPIELLSIIGAWSKKHRNTVLAGSHSPSFSIRSRQIYGSLGVADETLASLEKRESENTLALFRSGVLDLVPKRSLAPPEKSDSGARSQATLPQPRAINIDCADGSVLIVPLNCAEAIQNPKLPDSFDIAAIISLDARPDEHFTPFVQMQIASRRVVAYCNIGQHGGSFVYAIKDERTQNWFRDTFPDGLPPGDTLLVADVDLDVTAVETGIANPSHAFELVSLAALVGEYDPRAARAKDLTAACDLTASSEERTQRLQRLQSREYVTKLMRRRVDRLLFDAQRGLPSETAIAQLGNDCVVSSVGSLEQLEDDLAAFCRIEIESLMASATNDDVTGAALLEVWRRCKKRETPSTPTSAPPPQEAIRQLIDREDEITRLAKFVDHAERTLLLVTGLPGIGKSSFLRKGFREIGVLGQRWVSLARDASAAYLLAAISGAKPSAIDATLLENPASYLRTERFRESLRDIRVLVIEGCQELLDAGHWREGDIGEVMSGLADYCCDARIKLVLESRRDLPFETEKIRSATERLGIQGFNERRNKYGVQLFESQLRRVGVPVGIMSSQEKDQLVSRLSGHPKALEVAANVCFDDGPEELLKAVSSGSGRLMPRIRSLFSHLALSTDESRLLALLAASRSAVPRSVITEVLSGNANRDIRELISLGAIEQTEHGWIYVANLMRGSVADAALNPEDERRLHHVAARTLADSVGDGPDSLEIAVEAEHHAALVGDKLSISTGLLDGALAAARAHYESQQYEAAAKILNVLLHRRKTRSVLRLAALVFARLRELDKAVALAKAAFQLDTRDTALLAILGGIALTQRDERLAESLLFTARDAGVEDADILILQGRLALRRSELNKAVAIFERAVKLTERNPWAFVQLGETYQRLGRLDHAIDALADGERFYYDRECNWPKAIRTLRAKLGVCYALAGKSDLARTYIEGIAAEERSPEAALAFATITKGAGEEGMRDALSELRRSRVSNAFERCQMHLFAGQCYLVLGEKEAANREFEKAFESDRGNVFAMLRWARNSHSLAVERRAEAEPSYASYVETAHHMALRAMEFDAGNSDAKDILHSLATEFPEVIEKE